MLFNHVPLANALTSDTFMDVEVKNKLLVSSTFVHSKVGYKWFSQAVTHCRKINIMFYCNNPTVQQLI